jgi:predicted ATPase/class 3 adenylate cyclase
VVELPSGTVTFLFTDIEGSTRLWEEAPGSMRDAIARHDEILRECIEAHRGRVVKQTGDGFHAVFAAASDAVAAAVVAQRGVEQEVWPASSPLRVRMGLHTGEAQERAGDYYGSVTNRAARLMGVANGGQIVVSEVTAGVVSSHLRDGVTLVPLGEHELRGVSARMVVFKVTPPGRRVDFPPLATVAGRGGNLPAPVTSFVGRADELEQVSALLSKARVVTLTGVGGVGKTRLALEVAAVVESRFRDGAWLVELAQVRDPEAVARAVATALKAPDMPGVSVVDALAEFLRARQQLLVLDNCEHLLDSVAELVRRLERDCPGVVVLATSREGLRISGEQLVAVGSLPLEEAVQLFTWRAVSVNRDFELTDANVQSVDEVCRRLDGIPLAIELGAARVYALSPAQIAQRLDQRFRLLAGGERGAVERHATLRAAIDWSYDLLSTEEQQSLARLSVFAGGCSLEAAEAVCTAGIVSPEDVLDVMVKLVARSLVVADTTSSGDTRYRLLETIRQYAEEHLDASDRDATRDRHARYYAEWIPVALGGLQSPAEEVWADRVNAELENLRSAIDWAVERPDLDAGCRLVAAAARPPIFRVPAGRAVLDRAARLLEVVRRTDPDHVAITAAAAAVSAALDFDHDRGTALVNEALTHAVGPDDPATFHAQAARGYLRMALGDLEAAVQDCRDCTAWVRRRGNDFELAWALAILAAWIVNVGALEEAMSTALEALDVSRRTGVPSQLFGALVALAQASIDRDPGTAHAYVREALGLIHALGPAVDDQALVSLMGLAVQLDDAEVALVLGRRILDRKPAEPLLQAVTLEFIAAVLGTQRPERAACLHGAVDAVAPGILQLGRLASIRAQAQRDINAALDPKTVGALHGQGAALSPGEALDFASGAVDEAQTEPTRSVDIDSA